MNLAYATFTPLNSQSAVVNMDYRFSNGKENHVGFSTVDVDIPSKLYDACYQRAEALADTQNCRLEQFCQDPVKDFRVQFINFQYFASLNFSKMEDAFDFAISRGFEAAIYNKKDIVGDWSPISGKKVY